MPSLFLTLPLNLARGAPTDSAGDPLTGMPLSMVDGNPSSFWSSDNSTGSVQFSLGTNSQDFDAYYLVCGNVAGYTATGLAAQTAPLTVSGGAAASDSKQYAFHLLSEQSGTSATFSWTSRISDSEPIRIYEFWVMRLLFNVSDAEGYSQISQSRSFRGAQIQEALDGTRTRTRPLGNDGKWSVQYEMNVLTDINTKINQLNEVFYDNPNFTHAVNTDVHPDRVYRAHISGDGLGYNYITEYTGSGATARFSIDEM